ncbi:MAG: carboxypeptidase regulatory-like domain-containing protein [Anaerolineae bacterium]|nr:carboxypeptidase regulatory-like domain-containing protein [Anaerolineae bacterium]
MNRNLLRWLWLPALPLALLLIQWSTIPRQAVSATPELPPLLAFYYGWYDEATWTSGLSPDLPLEPYHSSDPAVIARHVRQAQNVGIQGLVMSWYGPQTAYNQTESNFRLLLAEAQRRGFKAAIDFETRSPFLVTRADVVAALKYLLNTHTQHAAYFRFNNKPVIFFWQQERFTVDEWASIRQEVDPHHTTLWIADGTDLGYQAHFDGHHLYNIAWAEDVAETLLHWRNLVRWYDWFFKVDRYWVATTMPGFDERHLGRESKNYRDRGTGEFYKESWSAAMATDPDMLIITSFNEWLEHSQIEPSQSYGNYYLDLTRALRYNEPLPPTPVLPTPTPTPTPGHGSLIGLITDATTGEPLTGVAVSVDGKSILTDGQGYYRFEGVTEGLQVVTARFPGYITAEKPRVVIKGQLVWNSIALTPGIDPTATRTPTITPTPTHTPTPTPRNTATQTSTPLPPTPIPAANTGSLTGLITNAETGQRVTGAVVSANGQMVLTNQSGIYQLDGLLSGQQTVLAQHPQFHPTAQPGMVVANTVRWNSFSMMALPTPTATTTPTPTYTPTPTHTATPTPTATNTPTPTSTPTVTKTPTVTPTAQPGTLTGLITNAKTGQPLARVIVSVAGQIGQTNQSGVYLIGDLPAGVVIVTVNQPGFKPVSESAYVVSNQIRWHSLALQPLEPPTPSPTATFTPTPKPTATSTPVPATQTGKLIGLITNAQTGDRLVGVVISAEDQMVQTDSRGVYLFNNLPAGQRLVSIDHPGFNPLAKVVVVVANQTRWNSMALTPQDTPTPLPTATFTPVPTSTPTTTPTLTAVPTTGKLIGLISNAQTGDRLAAAAVSVAGQEVRSNSRGIYLFETLPAGQHLVSVDHPDYEPITKPAYVVAGQTRWNSMALTPLNTPTPESEEARLAPCDPIPAESYGTLAVVGPPTDRPAAEHADLNLALRGYTPTQAHLGFIDLVGSADEQAPQLVGLFTDQRTPIFNRVYQVNHWDWDTNSAGDPITDVEVTLTGLQVEPAETIHVPFSGYNLGQGYTVLVLFADSNRITLKYTGEDNVVSGYTLHVEGICVESNLLALYEQTNAAGRGRLPALRAGQAFGRAQTTEIQVAIRDAGRFMDPRVRKDWWQGR